MAGKKAQTKKGKLLEAHHTGKLRHHRHTSYGALALVLLLTFVPLLSITQSIASAAEGDMDGGGEYGTYAVVPGPEPKTAPVITAPQSGQAFTTADPVRVSGSCESRTLVKVYKNEIFSGAALCTNGSFSLDTNLFAGNNSLMARTFNTLDAASPDSAPVAVTLALDGQPNLANGLVTSGAPAGQLVVTSDQSYRGVQAGKGLSWNLILAGGAAPYAVSVSWGDGKTDVYSQTASGTLKLGHVYEKANAQNKYDVLVKVSDAAGNKAYLQLVAIVSGEGSTGLASTVKTGYDASPWLRLGWQVFGGALLAVLGFWLGEKYKLYSLRHAGKAV